ADFAGDGDEVKDGVGGSAAGRDAGDGVLERLTGNDLRGAAIGANCIHDHASGLARCCELVFVGGGNAGELHGRDAEHLAAHGHGVGGELASAGACAGAGIGFKSFELCIIDFAGCVRTYAFEDVLNRYVDSVHFARGDGAAVEHHARD